MTGDLPPSSSDTRFSVSVAALLMSLPTSVEPVKATLSTPGCATSAAPAVSPRPVRMLTTPGGKPASAIELGEPQRGERRLLGGLQHQVQPVGECRPELPRGHRQREVPRHDLRHDADRLALRVGVELNARRAVNGGLEGRAFDLGRPAGHVAEVITGTGDIDHGRHELGLAVVDALELRQLVHVLLNQIRQLPQQRLPVGGQHVSPGTRFERLARGGHGAIDVHGVGIGDLGDLAPGCRVDHGDALPGVRLHPFAADEQAGGALEKLRNRRGRFQLSGDLQLG